ncbi:ABC transporter substrate-binding protein [Jiangella alkaliphila]|uniref:Carbohydrate ABC transporter substrate-binding protein, CUT1 family n=1 Tax=Jiangella alkaliphila TaxID=419479 RepID=A0A1H2LEZ2_9ACTN|nr:extracellular solute-binding protein [Jiangella alkaliphila]SDU79151.1 carbohydrate ABC transporter substrate-binding protein, CUT1 family [Jiangella alkaliphila]
MSELMARPSLVSRRTVLAGALGAAGVLLAGCGAGGTRSGSAGTISWASWGNPGEVERLEQFNEHYSDETGVQLDYQLVTGDYVQKVRTQLVGGQAPDAFWADDSIMGQAIQSELTVNLSELAGDSGVAFAFDDYYPALASFCQAPDGSFYGVPIDANPMAFWFNKDLLAEAGITTDPAQLQEAGSWDRAALTTMLGQLKDAGITGLIYEATWWSIFSWISTFGGATFDDTGRAVFHEDPTALDALEWLFDQTKEGTAVFAGSLPEGQGVDALFYSGQLATIQYGRWILPNLEQLSFGYDIAPLPSVTGADVSSVAVLVGAMCVNTDAGDVDAAARFVAAFTDQDGARFRLSDGGNAVPALSGISEVVTEGGLPEHGSWFNDIAANAFHPTFLRDYPDRNVGLPQTMDALLRDGVDAKTFAEQTAAMVNGEQ